MSISRSQHSESQRSTPDPSYLSSPNSLNNMQSERNSNDDITSNCKDQSVSVSNSTKTETPLTSSPNSPSNSQLTQSLCLPTSHILIATGVAVTLLLVGIAIAIAIALGKPIITIVAIVAGILIELTIIGASIYFNKKKRKEAEEREKAKEREKAEEREKVEAWEKQQELETEKRYKIMESYSEDSYASFMSPLGYPRHIPLDQLTPSQNQALSGIRKNNPDRQLLGTMLQDRVKHDNKEGFRLLWAIIYIFDDNNHDLKPVEQLVEEAIKDLPTSRIPGAIPLYNEQNKAIHLRFNYIIGYFAPEIKLLSE